VVVNRLEDVLDDVAAQAKLYDVTDAAVRGGRRRRRVRLVGNAAVAVLLVVGLVGLARVVANIGTGVAPPDRGPGRETGDPPALVVPLLETPTRGSLAGDAGFIGAVLDRVAGHADQFGLPSDRARLRVLFAGDVPGGHRLVLVAGATSAPRMVHLTGGHGTGANQLVLTGWGDVDAPVVRSEWRDLAGKSGYALVFGPAGYDVAVSAEPRYHADGTVEREWHPEPAGYVLRDTDGIPRGLRIRISRGNVVLYEDAVSAGGAQRTVDIDPNPLYGRGKPAPRAAKLAAEGLAYSTGLVGPDVGYVVLWSDDFPVDDPNGGGSGLGQIATVMAVTADGGGPYLTMAADTNKEPNARNHPTGAGVLGDPDRGLVVMRPPTFGPAEPEELQIVAPPAAVRADFLRGGAVVASTPLANGVGRLYLPGPTELTVRVFDANGVVVAERAFADVSGLAPYGLYEPAVKGW
jgi:hypothetical protein